jgi:hypothetical protein
MKKIVVLFAVIFMISFAVKAQDSFTREYYSVAIYEDGAWGDWQDGHNIFVFNANSDGDVVQTAPDGSITVYSMESDVYEDVDADGNAYQGFDVIDDEGLEAEMRLYDDGDLMIIYDVEPVVMVSFTE